MTTGTKVIYSAHNHTSSTAFVFISRDKPTLHDVLNYSLNNNGTSVSLAPPHQTEISPVAGKRTVDSQVSLKVWLEFPLISTSFSWYS